MVNAKCKAIVACQSLIPTCLEAARDMSIPLSKIYELELPKGYVRTSDQGPGVRTIKSLISQGSSLPPLEPLKWDTGQGTSQVAYLCPTSGTSGKQKLAMLTHYGLIANVMQTAAFEDHTKTGATEVEAGAVPFSHSYGIVVAHLALWRGDQFVVFPRFDMQLLLESVAKYKIERLYLVGEAPALPRDRFEWRI